MSHHFVVEADRRVVGVAVRVVGGYQFFSSNRAFQSLEGKVFPRAKAMQQQVAEQSRRLRQSGGSVQ